MSTLRLVHADLQTVARDSMARAARVKGQRRLAQAQALGAIIGLFGGLLAPLCGGLLTAASWFVTNSGMRQSLSTTGTVLLFLTIPLLMLGASCMDWREGKKLRPYPKGVRTAEGENRSSLKIVRPGEVDD